MPRRRRQELEGGVQHVFARGNNRQLIFRDDDDRRMYLAMLRAVVEEFGWRLLSFCLMGNHVHLLVETPNANLGVGMHRLHSLYVQRFHERHETSGRLFGDRYGARLMETEEQLRMASAYIARNPLEANLCAAAEDWPWSSHAATMGQRPIPRWLDVQRLLSYFESLGGSARERYAALVLAKK